MIQTLTQDIDGHTVKWLHSPVGGCVLSDCDKYRYLLSRPATDTGRLLGVIGHNPSKADHVVGDLTVTKLLGFAARLGCTRLALGNVFAYRATDPSALLAVDDPVGPVNGHFLELIAECADVVLACWGTIDRALWGKAAKSMAAIRAACMVRDKKLMCLGKTKDGKPRHPSRLGYDDGVKALCAF